MTSFTEQIVNCGYTGPINEEHKASIIRAIVLHATTKRTAMLSQLQQGLDVYDFLKVIKGNPEHCRGLFVAGNIEKVDSHYIVSRLKKKILNYFQDFLLELEDADPEDHNEPSVPRVMQWLSAFKIVVRFNHNCFDNMPGHTICFPVVSACTQTVTFPTAHLNSFEEFKESILISLKCGAGFHRI
uniref:HECT domain-containing protein n=1 Tax=Oryzias latipes TaxID=8090 RepID=A0A3P9I735_ORYLA